MNSMNGKEIDFKLVKELQGSKYILSRKYKN